uniref:Uncharacterized protein n=1 Tax=uncultured marine group II/III euryarchaeote KM3_89_F04 TaxID=1456539 RepID=A0A075I331_9EURY|nr:hypothetical protein [uncultured marine group II/III euryarchaeote KM3_89_F04]
MRRLLGRDTAQLAGAFGQLLALARRRLDNASANLGRVRGELAALLECDFAGVGRHVGSRLDDIRRHVGRDRRAFRCLFGRDRGCLAAAADRRAGRPLQDFRRLASQLGSRLDSGARDRAGGIYCVTCFLLGFIDCGVKVWFPLLGRLALAGHATATCSANKCAAAWRTSAGVA